MGKKGSMNGLIGAAAPIGAIVGLLANDEVREVVFNAANETITAVSRYAHVKIDRMSASVEVPEVYRPEHPLKLEDAKAWLEERKLICLPVEANAGASLARYSNWDVVGWSHKPKQKVQPGERISVYYVTPDVVEQSRKLLKEEEERLAEVEKLKADNKEAVAKKKSEKREEAKQRLVDIGANVRDGLGEVTGKAVRGMADTARKFPVKRKPKDQSVEAEPIEAETNKSESIEE